MEVAKVVLVFPFAFSGMYSPICVAFAERDQSYLAPLAGPLHWAKLLAG